MIEINEKIEEIKDKNIKKELLSMHYYGDTTRKIYLTMAVIMLVVTPFFKEELPLPAFFSIIGVLVLSIFAGLTNPKLRLVIIFDFIISLALLLFFGFETISSYKKIPIDLYFLANLILSIFSVFSIYFSSKTLRGHLFP